MEPEIRYTTTADGVSVAYWALGEGEAFLLLPPIGYSHLQLEWRDIGLRSWYERLAATHQTVRFDPRGFGLSDRETSDFSLDTLARDIEQLMDRLGLAKLSLFAAGH